MQLASLPEEFQAALSVLKKIESAGYEAYFVGGAVRDALLNQTISDVDIATSAFPEEVKHIFTHTIDTGLQHGTVTVLSEQNHYEITTFRTESGYQDFRRPDHVTFVRSLKDDLQRRDFTINALAMDRHGQIFDYFSGLTDLKLGIIRAVGNPQERFQEDALRMMRALRFAAKLGFTIETATWTSLVDHAPLLQNISHERLHEELVKMMQAPDWWIGLKDFIKSGLYRYCPLLTTEQELVTLQQRVAGLQSTVEIHDTTVVWALIIWVFQIQIDNQGVANFSREWRLANETKQQLALLFSLQEALMNHTLLDPTQLFKFNSTCLMQAQILNDILGRQYSWDSIKQAYAALPIHHQHELCIDGQTIIEQLGIKPGRQVGQLLHTALLAVVTGQVPNCRVDLIEFLRQA